MMSSRKARSEAKLQVQLQLRTLTNRRMTLKHHYTHKQCRVQKYFALVKQQGSTFLASIISEALKPYHI